MGNDYSGKDRNKKLTHMMQKTVGADVFRQATIDEEFNASGNPEIEV
jgi:hypothetical protein